MLNLPDLINLYITVLDPETWLCSPTPRFSYAGPETGVRAGQLVLVMVCTGRVYRGGMGTGWVAGWAIPGAVPTQPRCSRREVPPSEAGPGRPAGPGVGGVGPDGRTGGRWAGRLLHPPLRGPVGPCRPSLVQDP